MLRRWRLFSRNLSEASTAVEPSKRSFNDPASWLRFEPTDTLRACDDFNCPAAELGDHFEQLLAAIEMVSKDMTQLRKQHPEIFQKRRCAVNLGCWPCAPARQATVLHLLAIVPPGSTRGEHVRYWPGGARMALLVTSRSCL